MARPELPFRFPNEADQIHQQAAQFQRLAPAERFAALLDLIGFGQRLMAASPHREAGERLRAAQEEESRRALKELFARHGL